MKNIIITGASSGIGMEFARQLAPEAERLLLIARRADALEKLREELTEKCKVHVHTLALDLTNRESYAAIRDYIEESDFVPDCLINNAGVGRFGPFREHSAESIRNQIELNIMAPTLLSSMLIPFMEENAENFIVNVSSTFAFRKCPRWSVYAAAKSYIFQLTRSLQMEEQNRGIHFAVFCPGRTETEFRASAGASESTNGRGADASEVVAYALTQMKRKKKVIIPGLANKAKRTAFRWMPEFLSDMLIK